MWATSGGSLNDPMHLSAFYRLLEAPAFLRLYFYCIQFSHLQQQPSLFNAEVILWGKRVLLTMFHAPGRRQPGVPQTSCRGVG